MLERAEREPDSATLPDRMPDRARLIGINHVALEVGDLDAALELYGRLFAFELRGRARAWRSSTWATSSWPSARAAASRRDDGRHFGLVVDDKEAVRAAVEREGLETLPGRRLDFYDPWGNRFEVVDYRDIQFDRVPGVKRKLGIEDLEKSEAARAEIRERGLGCG